MYQNENDNRNNLSPEVEMASSLEERAKAQATEASKEQQPRETGKSPEIKYNYDPYSGMRTGGPAGTQPGGPANTQPGGPAYSQPGGPANTPGYGAPAGAPGYGGPASGQAAAPAQAKKKMPEWAKVLLIIAAVVLVAVFAARSCSRALENTFNPFINNTFVDEYDFTGPYIGVLHLTGTIVDGRSGDGYSHEWIISRVNHMTTDNGNTGMVLYINTPGGSAYATAELYHALEEYKAAGKPIYAYMANQATSGGYYAAMPADKIFANEECWTGSIGVVISGLYDLSGLFEKYGVKAENIVSGRNKDMGTNIKPLTEEQRQILQSLVDDSFDRFVAAVVKGRNLPEAKVRELADGRIYTANQALENKLIDEIGSLDDCINALQEEKKILGNDIHEIIFYEQESLLGILGFDSFKKNTSDAEKSDLAILNELMNKNSEFEILCIAPKKVD